MTINVINPYTQKTIGSVPTISVEELRQKIEVAVSYKADLSRYDRREILLKTVSLIEKNRDRISAQIIDESGLCWKDANHEITRTKEVFSIASALCTQDDSETYAGDISEGGKKRRTYTIRQPLKAVGIVTPFNHPLNQVAHKVAPGVATNNCLIVKPSEKTPLTAYLLANLLYEAGLPKEMLTMVSGDAEALVNEMARHDDIELFAFTGSSEIGKMLAQKIAYKKTLMELGGNAALVVMPDADIVDAAKLAVQGAFGNSGQRCTAVKRFLVHKSCADDFVKELVKQASTLKCGNPCDKETDIGTVIDEDAAKRIEDRVSKAIKDGAQLLLGHKREGALYYPTVLDNVSLESELVIKETFGPVAPVIKFDDIDDAIGIINSTAFGLSSGICTDHWPTALRFISDLKVGSVNINEIPGYRTEMSPFGGVKDSGLGHKEGLVEAMRFYTNVKTVSVPWI